MQRVEQKRQRTRRSSAAGTRESQAEKLAPKHVTAFQVGLSNHLSFLSITWEELYPIIYIILFDIHQSIIMFQFNVSKATPFGTQTSPHDAASAQLRTGVSSSHTAANQFTLPYYHAQRLIGSSTSLN